MRIRGWSKDGSASGPSVTGWLALRVPSPALGAADESVAPSDTAPVQNPAAVYLDRLHPSGRRSMRRELDCAVAIFTDEAVTDAMAFDWSQISRRQVERLRSVMVDRDAAAGTVNHMLSGVRHQRTLSSPSPGIYCLPEPCKAEPPYDYHLSPEHSPTWALLGLPLHQPDNGYDRTNDHDENEDQIQDVFRGEVDGERAQCHQECHCRISPTPPSRLYAGPWGSWTEFMISTRSCAQRGADFLGAVGWGGV